MTKDLTPEEQKEISQAWYDFMKRTIRLDTVTLDNGMVDTDKHVSDQKPLGWHWFWGIYCIRTKVAHFPIFDFETVQNKLPDGHWLKKISIDFVGKKPIDSKQTKATDDTQKETPEDINNQYGALENEKTFNTLWKILKKHKDSKEITKIYFSGFPFKDDVNFSSFIFPIEADFSNTTFSKDVYFTNAVFSDTASFENAEFHGETANFRNATFKKEANFEETTFKNYANFKSATFSDRTIFQLAKFELHAPRFYGAKFNNELILNRIKLPDAKKDDKNKNDTDDKLYEKRVEENKSAYETLIHLMEKQNKHHERHRFFREEMRWRQLGNKITEKRLINAALQGDYEYFSLGKLIENSFTIAFFWLYDTTSEYGHGIGRAFGWWLLHIILGAIAIFIIASCVAPEFKDALFCSISTSFANANPFVFIGVKDGGVMACYTKLQILSPVGFGYVRVIQTIVGIPLLFILLTTLRVRFRIK